MSEVIHIMLDLETWGLTPGSDIRSIGAVQFDPVAGTIGSTLRDTSKGVLGDRFYVATENPDVSLDEVHGERIFSCWDESEGVYREYPLTKDQGTVDWWAQQSVEAQSAFENSVDLRKALQEFASFVHNLPATAPDDNFPFNVRLWCNGPHFDEAILAACYRAVDEKAPWSFRSPRDFRTIVEAAGGVDIPFEGTPHNALDDAVHQARVVIEAYRKLGIGQGLQP